METITILKFSIIIILIIYIFLRYIFSKSIINLFLIFVQSFSASFIFLKEITDTEIYSEAYYVFLIVSILFPSILLFNDAILDNKLKKKQKPLFNFHHYIDKEIELDTNEFIEPFSVHNIMIYDKEKKKELKKIYTKANRNINEKKFDSALSSYEIIIEINKKNPLVFFNYACVFYKLNNFESAFSMFLKTNNLLRASNLNKKRKNLLLSSSYYNAGNCLFHQKMIREAMYCYKKSIKYNENNLLAKENLVILYLAGSNLKEALQLYKESVKKYNPPFLYNLHLFMGKIYEKRNELEDSLESFINAKTIKKNAFVLHSIARILYNIGRFDDSIKEYDEIIAMYNDDEKAHIGSGLAYYKKGEVEKAKTAFKTVLHLREAKYNYAYILYKDSKHHEALPIIQDLLKNDPTVEDYKLSGSLYMKLGRYYEAIKYFNIAFDIEKDNYKIAYNLGLVYGMIKDYHTAKKHFETAFTLKSDDTDVLINIIKTNIKSNDYVEAKKYIKDNIHLLEGSDEGKKFLDQISGFIDFKGGRLYA